MAVFWNVAPYSVVDIDRRFRGAICVQIKYNSVLRLLQNRDQCLQLCDYKLPQIHGCFFKVTRVVKFKKNIRQLSSNKVIYIRAFVFIGLNGKFCVFEEMA
jgi:hypothetical protein